MTILLNERKRVVNGKPKEYSDSFHKFMDWYIEKACKIEVGKEENRDHVKSLYGRFGKQASDILLAVKQDTEKAKEGTKVIATYMQNRNLSWTLKTIADRMHDWVANPKEFA